MIAHLSKFFSIGLLATLCHVTVATLCATLLPVTALMANFIGFCCAVGLSYLGHARLTFAVESDHATHLPRFLLAALVGLAASSTITWAGHDRMGAPFWAVMLMVAVLVPMLNYGLLRLWVFAPSAHVSRERLAGGAASLGPALAVLAFYWNRSVNHDVAWYLIATQKWLAGAALYTDIVEINPPLAFYLTAPSVALAHATGLTPAHAFIITVAALITLSLRMSWPLLRAMHVSQCKAALFLALATAMAVLVGVNDIGQRDQLLVFFSLPWLLEQCLPAEHRRGREDVVRAMFAAPGICLKPYFLLLPACVTLWQMLRQGSWRPMFSRANQIFLIAGLVYVALVRIVHPAYFEIIVPLGRQVYGAYGFGWPGMRAQLGLPAVMLALLALAHASRRSAGTGLFLSAALAGLGSFFLQWTGFAYQAIPCAAFAAMGLIALVLSDRNRAVLRATAAAILAIVALTGALGATSRNAIAQDLAQRMGDHRSFALFSTDLAPGPPTALESHAEWVSRYPALWPVPGAINRLAGMDCGQRPAACRSLAEVLDTSRAHIIADLRQGHPQFVIVDMKSPFFTQGPIDWIGFLSVRPDFRDIMARYHCQQQTDRFQIWALGRPDREGASRRVCRRAASLP